jgi:hypothetical protein
MQPGSAHPIAIGQAYVADDIGGLISVRVILNRGWRCPGLLVEEPRVFKTGYG